MTLNLTTRYVTGLLLVAVTMVATFAVVVDRVNANRLDGYTINVAGMQRMLSQRILMLAWQLAGTDSLTAGEPYAAQLEQAAGRMLANHRELTEGAPSLRLSVALLGRYEGPEGIDQRVRAYAQAALELVDQFRSGAVIDVAQSTPKRHLNAAVDAGLLQQLDSAVTAYQQDYESRIEDFVSLELIILALGLGLLVLEVLLIFRPMARHADAVVKHLAHVNDELREFAYRISHDLRAPIASSLGLVAVAEGALAEHDGATASTAVAQIAPSLQQMDDLIGAMVAVTQNKHAEHQRETLQLAALVDAIVCDRSKVAGCESTQIRVSMPPVLELVTVRILLVQILENLIANAIKYRNLAEAKPTMCIEAHVNGDRCEIRVSDNGLGIPAPYRDRLFGMFQRFHPGISSGAGIGLYLVRQNARLLGGDATYEPLEQGSRFVVRIPMVYDASDSGTL